MSSEALIVQAIYSFKGTNNDELCFKKGDKITVTQKEDGGWWEGTFEEKTGWFPSNYVKECKDVTSPLQSPVKVTPEITQQRQYRAVVIKDLIDSEKAHITEMQGLVSNFLHPLEKSDILTRDEYRQLTGNLSEVLDTHVQLLNLVEECALKPSTEQRVGKLFLQWAPRMKSVHQTYCAMHPKAVCILDKYKDELTKFMETAGAVSPGLLVLTTGLSKAFRRLDKYPGMLQELERHVEESHPDRGDTQRSVAVYKEIASTCTALRRQKELELQVLTGPVRGWEGQSLSQLGDILHMGSVAVGLQHHDRYLVLFSSTLLVLSVSHRMSAFIYEGKLPLTGIIVTKLEDSETYKNAFEIKGSMIEPIIAICQSREEAQAWVDLLHKHTNNRGTVPKQTPPILEATNIAPLPPPHLDSRGYTSRASVLLYKCKPPRPFKLTFPPSTYPSASPYARLTKHISHLVRHGIITKTLLKNLNYPQYTNIGKFDLSQVKIRRHHAEFVFVKRSSNDWLKASVIVVSSESDTDSDDSSSSSNTSSSKSSSDNKNKDSNSDTDSEKSETRSSKKSRLSRQNAFDEDSIRSENSHTNNNSCRSSNPYGFIRYYNPDSCLQSEITESFIDHGENISQPVIMKSLNSNSKTSIVHTSSATLHLGIIGQNSETSEGSSFDCGTSKPYMACEDLLSIDDTLPIAPMTPLRPIHRSKCVPQNRQSCPTKLVANKFNKCSLTTINIPVWQSISENNLIKTEAISRSNSESSTPTHSSSIDIPANIIPAPDGLVAEILYNLHSTESDNQLRPLSLTHQPESTSSDKSCETVKAVITPPIMFRNENNNNPQTTISEYLSCEAPRSSLTPTNIGFRNHNINSDKPKRRSSVQENNINFSNVDSNSVDSNSLRRCISYHFLRIGPGTSTVSYPDNCCRCCTGACQSPRSSDSGMAGSCTLASPDLPPQDVSEYQNENEIVPERQLQHRFGSSSDELDKFVSLNPTLPRSDLSQSQIEAADFEAQCRCTSPFGSTPRTSCQPSTTSENILIDAVDSVPISTTSSCLDLTPYPTPHPWESENQIHRKLNSIRNAEPSKIIQECQNSTDFVGQHTQEVYRSGMYAHWWLKAKIPPAMVQSIVEDSRSRKHSSPSADESTASRSKRPSDKHTKRST